MQERLGLLASADPYIGKYYSVDHIRRKILRQTDQEIVEEDKQMAAEKEAGIIPPSEEEMMLAAQEMDAAGGLGNLQQDMDNNAGIQTTPKGGEI